MDVGGWDGYVLLVVEIVKFFKTGAAPMKPSETIEIFAFMEDDDESKKRDGALVKIKDLLKHAH